MRNSTGSVRMPGASAILFRILFYVLGLFILALGVSFSVNSNFGISPVNSIPAVLNAMTGLQMGNCVVIVFSLFIVLQILIKRKEFKPIHLTQLVFSTIFGKFVDLTGAILGDFSFPGLAGRIAMMLLSVLLIAIGVSLYVGVELINMPMEGLTMAITEKSKGKTFHQIKVRVDTTVVIIALILTFIFIKPIQANLGIQTYPTGLVYVGTVVSAVLVGTVMHPVQQILLPPVRRICFRESGQEPKRPAGQGSIALHGKVQ